MNRDTPTVSDYLLTRLTELGLNHLFGVPGDYTLDFLDRVVASSIAWIGNCNELNAGYAADGYARVNGLGAVCVTFGVGGLSLVNAIGGAYAEYVPVVVISGAPHSRQRAAGAAMHHLVKDYMTQAEIYRHVTVDSILLNNPETAPEDIDRVLSHCVTHQRPVYIELPTDMVHQSCHAPRPVSLKKPRTSDPAALDECVRETADLLNAAASPILLTGILLKRFGLTRETLALVETIELPYAATIDGKAVLPESHPQFMGIYMGAMSRDIVKEQLEASDGLLCLGSMLTDVSTGGYSARLPEQHLILASETRVQIKHHIYENIWLGDFIAALTKALKPRTFISSHPCAPHRPPDGFQAKAGKPLTVARFYTRINRLLDDTMILVPDVCDALFGACEIQVDESDNFISQSYYLSIGNGLPLTLGICLANPAKRPVLLIGDGGFQMTCQELSVLIREHCRPIIFLLNNDGYVIEEKIHPGPYNRILQWHYHKLPEVFSDDILAFDVRTEDALETAVDKACRAPDRLVFIHVHLPWGQACAAVERLCQRLRQLQTQSS